MSSRVCLLSVQGNNLYPSPHIATLRRILAFLGCILRRLPVFVTFAFFPLSFHPAYYCNSQQVVILRRILSLRKVLLSDLSPYCPCLDFFVAIPHRILFLLTVHIYRCIDNTLIYFSCCILRRLLYAFSDYFPLNPYKSFV